MMDPQAFKEFERTGWNQLAHSYSQSFGVQCAQSIPRLLALLDLQSGERVLDIACGTGVVSRALHDQGAQVTAIDNAENMLQEARRVNPGPDYRQGDAEALPFDDGTFDAAVINFGFLHFALPEAAISEAFRVLKHGGRFVCTDWCPPDESPYFAMVMAALRAHGNMDIPLPKGPAMFQFAQRDHAAAVFARMGFVDFLHEKLEIVSAWERDEQVLGQFLEGSVRLGTVLRKQEVEAKATIEHVVIEGAKTYYRDGAYRIPIPGVVMYGRKS